MTSRYDPFDPKVRVLGTVAQPAAIPSSFSCLSDAALATLVAGGDEHAFEVLYRRHRDGLFRFCRSITGNPEDAEEALQATMLNAYRALRDGARAAPLRPWLFRIAHNASVSLLRMRRVGSASSELESARDPRAGIHERVEHRERLRELIEDFGRLPVRQRAALALREMEGLSHAAVARALDTTPLDARHLVHSARSALTEQDAGRDEACDRVRGLLISGDRRVLRGRRISSHLRACEGCRAYAASERGRRAGLVAVFPVLSSADGERILDRILDRAAGRATRSPIGATSPGLLTGSRLVRIIGTSVGAGAVATAIGVSALFLGLPSHQGYSAAAAVSPSPPRAATVEVMDDSPIRSLARTPSAQGRAGETRLRRHDTVATIAPVASRMPRLTPGTSIVRAHAEMGTIEIVSMGDHEVTVVGAPPPPTPAEGPLAVAAPDAPLAVAPEQGPVTVPVDPPIIGSTPPSSVVVPPPGVRPSEPRGQSNSPPPFVPPEVEEIPSTSDKGPRPAPRGTPSASGPAIPPISTRPTSAFTASDPRAVVEVDPAVAGDTDAPPLDPPPPPAAVVEVPVGPLQPDLSEVPATVVGVTPDVPATDVAEPAAVVDTDVEPLPGHMSV